MKHKCLLLVLSFFLLALMPLSAQKSSNKKHFDIDKFKKEKAQFLTKEIGLTDSESKTFIPLVNELMDRKVQINRTIRGEIRDIRNKKDKSEADYEKLIEAAYEIRTKELELDKEYYIKLRKILPAEKIYKYQRAETKFMRKMVGNYKSKADSSKK